MPRSAPPRRGRRSCICTRATPKTASPTSPRRPSRRSCRIIKQRSNCVINLTTGGAPTMTVDERVRPAAVYKPEVASLNMGSMNFGLFPMLNRFKNSSTTGSASIWKTRTSCSATPSRTSNSC
jgi:uncharacterized protein (DUF849 family)